MNRYPKTKFVVGMWKWIMNDLGFSMGMSFPRHQRAPEDVLALVEWRIDNLSPKFYKKVIEPAFISEYPNTTYRFEDNATVIMFPMTWLEYSDLRDYYSRHLSTMTDDHVISEAEATSCESE